MIINLGPRQLVHKCAHVRDTRLRRKYRATSYKGWGRSWQHPLKDIVRLLSVVNHTDIHCTISDTLNGLFRLRTKHTDGSHPHRESSNLNTSSRQVQITIRVSDTQYGRRGFGSVAIAKIHTPIGRCSSPSKRALTVRSVPMTLARVALG